jgi:glutamate-1-semialdehyde 2,1-aminomutase
VQVPRAHTLVGLHFSPTVVRDYDEAKVAADTGLYRAFFHALLRRGIAFAPGPYEALFPSLAHTDDDIDRTIEAAADAAGEITRS